MFCLCQHVFCILGSQANCHSQLLSIIIIIILTLALTCALHISSQSAFVALVLTCLFLFDKRYSFYHSVGKVCVINIKAGIHLISDLQLNSLLVLQLLDAMWWLATLSCGPEMTHTPMCGRQRSFYVSNNG